MGQASEINASVPGTRTQQHKQDQKIISRTDCSPERVNVVTKRSLLYHPDCCFYMPAYMEVFGGFLNAQHKLCLVRNYGLDAGFFFFSRLELSRTREAVGRRLWQRSWVVCDRAVR